MQYLELFFIGFFTAFAGTSIPGLLNMTVVKIGKQEGTKSAYTFMFGTAIAIAIQVYISLFLVKFINFNDRVTMLFREAGLIIFLFITVYFLFLAPRIDQKKNRKKIEKGHVKQKNKLIYGFLLSAINLFPIPFYVFFSATLVSYNIMVFGQPNSSIFTVGVVLGSMLTFRLYLQYFKNKSEEESFVLKNINLVIGCITSLVSILTIYQLFFS